MMTDGVMDLYMHLLQGGSYRSRKHKPKINDLKHNLFQSNALQITQTSDKNRMIRNVTFSPKLKHAYALLIKSSWSCGKEYSTSETKFQLEKHSESADLRQDGRLAT